MNGERKMTENELTELINKYKEMEFDGMPDMGFIKFQNELQSKIDSHEEYVEALKRWYE